MVNLSICKTNILIVYFKQKQGGNLPGIGNSFDKCLQGVLFYSGETALSSCCVYGLRTDVIFLNGTQTAKRKN